MQITTILTDLISSTGYVSIFVLMSLESCAVPIPSEIVVPFAGYLASLNKLDLFSVVVVTSLANLLGSLLLYYIGKSFGRYFVLKYRKVFFLKEKHLALIENWFRKYGEATVFFSRMLPAVRTYASLPAGMSKMNLSKFSIYTLLGSIGWNFLLAYAGFLFGTHWEKIVSYAHFIGVTCLVAISIFIYTRMRK